MTLNLTFRRSNPGTTSYNSFRFWVKNGKKDRKTFEWKKGEKPKKIQIIKEIKNTISNDGIVGSTIFS